MRRGYADGPPPWPVPPPRRPDGPTTRPDRPTTRPDGPTTRGPDSYGTRADAFVTRADGHAVAPGTGSSPVTRAGSPIRRAGSPMWRREGPTTRADGSAVRTDSPPIRKPESPLRKAEAPATREMETPLRKAEAPATREIETQTGPDLGGVDNLGLERLGLSHDEALSLWDEPAYNSVVVGFPRRGTHRRSTQMMSPHSSMGRSSYEELNLNVDEELSVSDLGDWRKATPTGMSSAAWQRKCSADSESYCGQSPCQRASYSPSLSQWSASDSPTHPYVPNQSPLVTHSSSLASTISSANSTVQGLLTEKIMVAIDEGMECQEALQFAITKGMFKYTKSVTLLHVLQPLTFVPQGLANPSIALAFTDTLTDRTIEASSREMVEKERKRRGKALKLLEKVRVMLKELTQVAVELMVVEKHGPPSRHILEAAVKMDASKLIMGRYPCSKIYRAISMEGISDYVIAKAPESLHVIAVRKRKRGGYLYTDRDKKDFWLLG